MIEEDFYGQCKIEEGRDLTEDVRAVVGGDCFENRRCNDPNGLGTSLDESEQSFVGFREECFGNCTNEDIGLGKNLQILASQRYKRAIKALLNNQIGVGNKINVLAISMNGQERLVTGILDKYSGTNPQIPQQSLENQYTKNECNINAIDLSDAQSINKNKC